MSYTPLVYPDGFLDVRRVISGNGERILFDGFMQIVGHREGGVEVPAYIFGVQTLWHMKVMAAYKDVIANCVVQNPGRYGNSVIIHLYTIQSDGLVRQADDPYAAVKIEFNGEGE